MSIFFFSAAKAVSHTNVLLNILAKVNNIFINVITSSRPAPPRPAPHHHTHIHAPLGSKMGGADIAC